MRGALYIFLLLIQFNANAQVIAPENELLWEVTAPNGKRSYLFGSLHSNDRRLFRFSDSTYIAFNRAKTLAIELDIAQLFPESAETGLDVPFNFDNEGEPYTNTDWASKTKYGDEDGMPQFLDAYFQQVAEIQGKAILPLESIEMQRSIMSNSNISDVTDLHVENLLTTGDKMMDFYLKGDIYRLHDLMKNSLELYGDLYERLIVDRNAGMVKKLVDAMNADELFCVVGAGHLAGDKGLIRLLRASGMKVRKVLATYSDDAIAEKTEFRSARSFDYVNDTLGIKISFPGKPRDYKDEYSDALVRLYYVELGQGNTYVVEIYERTFDTGLNELADRFIASPANAPAKEISLPNGGEAIEGIADTYPEGFSWTRVVMTEDLFLVLKAYGGNKFMNSPRPFRFFDRLELF